jgi:hypothetical protein
MRTLLKVPNAQLAVPSDDGVAASPNAHELAQVDRPAAPEAGPVRHVEALSQLRAIWWFALGGLWIVDGLLQAQPGMFTPTGLLGNALLPAAQGQPSWIAGPMLWGSGLWAGHATFWNAAVVILELSIGCLILVGRRWPMVGRTGLVLSIAWGLIVWYFGEGLGGLFIGSASYLAGAPGSALLYVLLAIALLLPDVLWSSPRLLPAFRVAVSALWAVGALLQMATLYWTPLGLASILQSVAMMPLPFGLTALDAQLINAMASAPVLWNAVLCSIMIGLAGALLLGRGGKAIYVIALVWFALVWLVFVWMVFQGLGMVFSGMATDPNTPPVWALLLLPSLFTERTRISWDTSHLLRVGQWLGVRLDPARRKPL